MTQRSATSRFPLLWEFAGGNALAGEESTAAAVRELYEETGLAVEPDALVHIGRYVEGPALVDLYAAEAPHEPVLRPDPDEVCHAERCRSEDVIGRLESGGMAVPWARRLLALCPELMRVAGAITQRSSSTPRAASDAVAFP